jgi:hypothetical protein
MSTHPDFEGPVTMPPDPGRFGAERAAPVASEAIAPAPQEPAAGLSAEPIMPPGLVGPAQAVAPVSPQAIQAWAAPVPVPTLERTRGAGGWIGMVAIGAVGLIAAAALGYLLYSTAGQRDAALRQVASTKATLTDRQVTLNATQNDLATRKATAAYLSMYVSDGGRVSIDYQKFVACTTFGSCRTAAQSALTNMQTFQSDRSAATVPVALLSSDGMLRDALSAAIAADQELISGMDNTNDAKFKDGWHKLTSAMLGLAKAEAALGAAVS